MKLLNNIKYFFYQYSCFFLYGITLSTFGATFNETLSFSLAFAFSILLLDFVHDNPITFKEQFISTLYDNLYVIVLGITAGYFNVDILTSILYGIAIVSLVALKVSTRRSKLF